MSTYRLWLYPHEPGEDEPSPALRAALQNKIESAWDRLETQLQARGPYLPGGDFSGADLLLAMLLRWSRNMPRPASEWPALNRLAALVRAPKLAAAVCD